MINAAASIENVANGVQSLSVKEATRASQVTTLFETLSSAESTQDRRDAAAELADIVKTAGIPSLVDFTVLEKIQQAAEHKKNPKAREGAMFAIGALRSALGQASEPYLIPLLPAVLDRYADKEVFVRDAAQETCDVLTDVASQHSFKAIVPHLIDALNASKKWQSHITSLGIIDNLSKTAPVAISSSLPELIPIISERMWDTKQEVQKAATDTMNNLCAVVGNTDILPFVPHLVNCIRHPEEVAECVYKLSATTFVAVVEAPALAIMAPLLERALAERKPAIVRQAAVIIENMCKLVEDPIHAVQFIPKLKPGLDRAVEVSSDPELRNVAARALKTLIRVCGFVDGKINEDVLTHESVESVLPEFQTAVGKAKADPFFDTAISYVCSLIAHLVNSRSYEKEEWTACVEPYLKAAFNQSTIEKTVNSLYTQYYEKEQLRQKQILGDVEEEGEELCNCEFSLAYGGMILLNKTRMRLVRGQRYGLCGPNGAGKTTLMRAIANGQVDGFPPADVLKTVFVEHSLQASEAELSVVDFLCQDPSFNREEVVAQLSSVGFDDELRAKAVSSLSGGWKMKLELCRAILLHADILLLDEPTNHLDVQNVTWLVNYLNGLTNVTSLIVSHDSGFLDRVCTNIIHYENRKLKTYRGNLSEFVKVRPEAKAYYELASTQYTFAFPEPGFLDGVKSKDKAILKVLNASFTYPGAPRPTFENCSAQISLSSRIACLGRNGAGKSTLIKCITGELLPQKGEIWKHPNLRFAYVAQHAFHHIEQHLDKTANEYIRWRYQYGQDKELLSSASRQISDEERKEMEKKISIEGEKRQIEALVGRKNAKKSFEYEVKWVNMPHDDNTWMTREQLEELGFFKMIQSYDDEEAARQAAFARPLTTANVEKHLGCVGLEPEFATHSRIRGLSGGQKIKAVLAASTWLQPHVIILDEPSNYLDRDSLGALAGAIKDFGGGVVIISHNNEFVEAVCTDRWDVADGKVNVTTKNGPVVKEIIVQAEAETKTDAFGNVTKVKSTRKLSRKELKAKEKKKAAAKKNGQAVSDDEDDDF